MIDSQVLMPTAVLSILRGHESVLSIADRFGVTEAQVMEWRDLFIIAGVLALNRLRSGQSPRPDEGMSQEEPIGEPTTRSPVGDPTTPIPIRDPTTDPWGESHHS